MAGSLVLAAGQSTAVIRLIDWESIKLAALPSRAASIKNQHYKNRHNYRSKSVQGAKKPGQTILVRQARMITTGDWLDSLLTGKYWRRREVDRYEDRGTGRYRARRSRHDDSDNEPDDDSSRLDEDAQRDIASQFYSGDGDTFRTVCVRKCDGYFVPISFSTTDDYFERDQKKCRRRFGRSAKLYVFRNPGGSVEDMEDLDGNRYADLKTAFLYRTSYNPHCSTRPQPWEQVSLERHRLYRQLDRLENAARRMRGRKKRRARRAVRQFRRQMRWRLKQLSRRNRQAIENHGRLQFSAGQYQTASTTFTMPLVKRFEPLSPVRSLPVSDRPDHNESAQGRLVSNSGAAIPENDDGVIYLPTRRSVFTGGYVVRAAAGIKRIKQIPLPDRNPVRVTALDKHKTERRRIHLASLKTRVMQPAVRLIRTPRMLAQTVRAGTTKQNPGQQESAPGQSARTSSLANKKTQLQDRASKPVTFKNKTVRKTKSRGIWKKVRTVGRRDRRLRHRRYARAAFKRRVRMRLGMRKSWTRKRRRSLRRIARRRRPSWRVRVFQSQR